MKDDFFSVNDDGVSGVCSSAEASYELGFDCEDVDEFAFPFVSPVQSEDCAKFVFCVVHGKNFNKKTKSEHCLNFDFSDYEIAMRILNFGVMENL